MKKSSIIFVLLGVLILLLVAAVGGYFLGGKYSFLSYFSKSEPIQEPPAEEQLVGNDRDVHGCIPSAGYIWCEVKQKCLRPWEESCTSDTLGVSDSIGQVKDQTQIISDIKQDLLAKYGDEAKDLSVTVAGQIGTYFYGSALDTAHDGTWFGRLNQGKYELIWWGDGVPDCASIKDYPDLPTNFVEQCWDIDTQQLITR